MVHAAQLPSAAQLTADQSTQDRMVTIVSDIYAQTASRADSTLTPQEAEIVAASILELNQGKYRTFDSADELIKHLKSDYD